MAESECFTLSSQELSIRISSLGAELKSVADRESGYEFMWQGDPAIWGRSAPVLFPIVGRALGDRIRVEGQEYPMGQHGFARDLNFDLVERTEDSLSLQCAASDETLRHFPFEFWLSITYRLFGRRIKVTYDVLSRESIRTLHYSIGAHPGFRLPVADLGQYRVCFELAENLERVLLSQGLLSTRRETLGCHAKEIRLSPELFSVDRDAIILTSLNSTSVELLSLDDPRFRIDMTFEGFPYFGIWTKPDCHQFVCLEPWCGLADQEGEPVAFSDKRGILSLAPGELRAHSYHISFFPPSP